MQSTAWGWLFRLCQEPRRLWMETQYIAYLVLQRSA